MHFQEGNTFHIKKKKNIPSPFTITCETCSNHSLFHLFNFCLVLDEEFSPLGIKEVDYTSPTRIVQGL